MNAYDFDKTIYDKDCSVGFYFYSWKKHFFLMIWYLFKTIGWAFLYLIKKIDFKALKEKMFSYVTKIKNLDKEVNDFWEKHKNGIKKFYLNNQKDDDVIISASFDFILKPIIKELGIKNLICTKYNLKTGKIIGNNCHDKEKVIEFKKQFKNKTINEAYSDSMSDLPMLEYAKKAYVVKGDKLISLKDFRR